MATTSLKQTQPEDCQSWPGVLHEREEQRRPRVDICESKTEIAPIPSKSRTLDELKNRRSRALAFVTRKKNLIEPLLTDDVENLAVVESLMEGYVAAFQKFFDVHEIYDNGLRDTRLKAQSLLYFIEVERSYKGFCQKVTEWTTTFEVEVDPEDSVSQLAAERSSKRSEASRTRRSETSSTKSESRAARIAELEARRASIQRRKELHERELRLKEERLKLDIERENIELEEELESLMAKEDMRSRSSSQSSKVSSKRSTRKTPSETSRKQQSLKQPELKLEQPKPKFEDNGAVETPKERQLIPPNFYSPSFQLLDQQSKIMSEIVQQQQRATLPQKQVPTFNGDPLDYCSFIRAFDTLIASKEPDWASKLYYLEQYTADRPKELVKSCLHMSPEEGYFKARELLEKRFGDKHRIAMAHVDKLISTSPIKSEDANALERYSISLTSCKNALQGIGYLNKIENPDSMRKVIEKLPFQLQYRWRDIADNIINVQHREITMEDISAFVEQKARSMNNPIFGKLPAIKPRTETLPRKKFNISSQKVSFSSQLKDSKVTEDEQLPPKSPNKKLCYICDSEHSVVDCPVFKGKDHKERMDLASKKRLCFSCLRKGHQSASCYKKKPCNNCNRRHNTLLHSEEKAINQAKDASAQTTGPKSFACSSTRSADSSSTGCSPTILPILPVKVRKKGDDHYIQTYALLDSGSNSCFCSESLVKRLHVAGKKTNIKLTTVNKTDEIQSQVIRDLEISDLDENTTIKLHGVFSRPAIPIPRDEIPSQADVESWFGENIEFQTIDSDVDLLIGMNVPQALLPLEVISTADDGPYATKVKLGWVINGPTGINQKRQCPMASFQATVHPMCSACVDFLDTYSDSTELSRDEIKFMDTVKKSVNHLDNGHYEVCLPKKYPNICLPNNRTQAERRATHLKKKLLNDSKFKEDYVKFNERHDRQRIRKKGPQGTVYRTTRQSMVYTSPWCVS